MTDLEKMQATLEELLANQRRMQETLEGLTRGAAVAPEPQRADDLVGVDYFQRATGLARVTILQGKAGTGAVPLQSKRPKRWRKADVDAFQRARAAGLRAPREKAFKLLDRRGGRTRPAA